MLTMMRMVAAVDGRNARILRVDRSRRYRCWVLRTSYFIVVGIGLVFGDHPIGAAVASLECSVRLQVVIERFFMHLVEGEG